MTNEEIILWVKQAGWIRIEDTHIELEMLKALCMARADEREKAKASPKTQREQLGEMAKELDAIANEIAAVKKQRRFEAAKAALAGVLADSESCGPKEKLARLAVEYADALLAELDKPKAKS